MKSKANLPDFAFLKSFADSDDLHSRNVIIHTGSFSILEVYEGNIDIEDSALSLSFSRINRVLGLRTGNVIREYFTIVLHHSPFFSIESEERYVIDKIVLPAIRWFKDYCDMMDELAIDKI